MNQSNIPDSGIDYESFRKYVGGTNFIRGLSNVVDCIKAYLPEVFYEGVILNWDEIEDDILDRVYVSLEKAIGIKYPFVQQGLLTFIQETVNAYFDIDGISNTKQYYIENNFAGKLMIGGIPYKEAIKVANDLFVYFISEILNNDLSDGFPEI